VKMGKSIPVLTGILCNYPQPETRFEQRLNILDLTHFDNENTRILVLNHVLRMEQNRAKARWEEAIYRPTDLDNRTPVFIILDEAHNYISATPRNAAVTAVREQFRTIAAEGRKYGIFLVLASQRPDKLDPLVLSECENKVLMKLDSESILNTTAKILGMEDLAKRTLNKCLEFGNGRAMLYGKWAPNEPKLLYSAARRTVEGGRNLRAEYWAEPLKE